MKDGDAIKSTPISYITLILVLGSITPKDFMRIRLQLLL